MKCYYEILNISRNADESEIKNSYKKLALRWHPDKNIDNPDETKEQFQLVQQAYEVLSDAHERAWYDNHREQILHGKESHYEDNSLNVFEYFTASCFKGFGNDPGGFYGIYNDVFERIAAEDTEFMDDEIEIKKIPKFGTSESSYEEIVAPFYAYWQSYCTKKSYSWLCPYNIKEIKDRRILREIDKDMRKVVQKARKERNEEVRNLVSFVRKRDKRVQAYRKYLEDRAAENRKKQKQNSIEQFRKRNREIQEQKQSQEYVLNEYEERLRELEQEYSGSEDEYNSDEESDNLVENTGELDINDTSQYKELYCVACNKNFKNHKAFQNHEASKKHYENTEKLIKEMRAEQENVDLRRAEQENVDLKNEWEEIMTKSDTELVDDILDEKDIKNKSKKKKSNRKQKVDLGINNDEVNVLFNLSDESDWTMERSTNKKCRKPNHRKNQHASKSNVEESTCSTISEKSVNTEVKQVDLNHTCATCNSKFESKNKLFSHLKGSGHGKYISKSGSLDKQEKSIKKGKKSR